MAEQASEMAGFPKPREGTFVWTEIATNDAEKSKAFFYDRVWVEIQGRQCRRGNAVSRIFNGRR
jgi:predicted enzyme related to lactoylglutathione lyase